MIAISYFVCKTNLGFGDYEGGFKKEQYDC